MKINLDNNIGPIDETQESGGFWHSGWAFLVFFSGIIGIIIAISYLIKWLM
jgi:hypothetical protein